MATVQENYQMTLSLPALFLSLSLTRSQGEREELSTQKTDNDPLMEKIFQDILKTLIKKVFFLQKLKENMKQKIKDEQFSQTLITASKIVKKEDQYGKKVKAVTQNSGCRKSCQIQKKRDVQLETTQRKHNIQDRYSRANMQSHNGGEVQNGTKSKQKKIFKSDINS